MKKKLIIIISSILALIALIVGLTFLIININKSKDPIFTMSSSDYLTHFPAWQATSDSRIEWRFHDDGTGSLTTNSGLDTYDFTWQLAGSTLTITTAWLYDMEDTFSFTTNREEQTFTIVDTAEEKITVFAPVPEEEPTE